jgi:hypothetical protein
MTPLSSPHLTDPCKVTFVIGHEIPVTAKATPQDTSCPLPPVCASLPHVFTPYLIALAYTLGSPSFHI